MKYIQKYLLFLLLVAPCYAQHIKATTTEAGTLTGTIKNLSAIRGADQFSAATVAAPSLAAGLISVSSGGSVAANTYNAAVTYTGAAGGETTASGASGTIVTSGSTSILYVSANDAPPGATCFNAYVQSAGSGSFYKQGGCTAMGGVLAISSTPATSGATPPVSNTATAVMAGAAGDLAGPGGILVPSTMAAIGTAGVSGDPASGQTILDFRNGNIASRIANGAPLKTSSYADVLAGWMVDYPITNQLSTGQQAQGLTSVIHASPSPFYGGGSAGTNPANPSAAVAAFFEAERGGTRTEAIWGNNSVAGITNQNNPAYAYEGDCNNNTGSDATNNTGCIGFNAASIGPKKAYAAFSTVGSGGWVRGLDINGVQYGVACGSTVTSRCITETQGVDGTDIIYLQRNKDVSPTGNFLRFTPQSGSDLFDIDTGGSITVITGMAKDAAGHKHARFGATCTTTNVAGNICTTAYNWTTAFPDNNYTAVCWGVGVTSGEPILSLASQTAAAVTVNVQTAVAAVSGFNGVNCIADRDPQ